MKTLLKNAQIVDVFTETVYAGSVLLEDARIIGCGDYPDAAADTVTDLAGKYVCPGFIDGHIHIESTMLTPYAFAKACLPHGTTTVISDPHEIANVCGTAGIDYMLQASEGLPLTVYYMAPSCVPATGFDESRDALSADRISPFFSHPRILGLAEMMNYVGAVAGDENVLEKIAAARAAGVRIDGHAPLLTGSALDRYIALGIRTDHECTSYPEAFERVRKGQWVMLREGTAAKNLDALLPLLDGVSAARCLLVTDDREPGDLLRSGHIDHIVRRIIASGRPALTAIRAATLNAALCFGLTDLGAVAPGYRADLLILDDLDALHITDVYHGGRKVVENGVPFPFAPPVPDADLLAEVRGSVRCPVLSAEDFHIAPQGKTVRAIGVIPKQILTDERIVAPDFSRDNGVDTAQDLLKIAVIERHHSTGHIGLGYICGLGLKQGAIASTVSHDSHNIIVVGTNDADMAFAANRIRAIGGGNVVVRDGEVLAEMRLPIAGLMTDQDAEAAAADCEAVRSVVHRLGVPEEIAPFMNMAFLSLPVIPHLKLTTQGLVSTDRMERVPLFMD